MSIRNSSFVTSQEFGEPVPDFRLPLLNGTGKHDLAHCLRGKAGAVIVFWSAVCAHCVRYDGYLNAFAMSHSQLGFAVIASRHGETLRQMQNAAFHRGLQFPIFLDSSGEVARQWHAQQTPRCYLISADGSLLYRGAIDNFKLPSDRDHEEYLEAAIRAFLAGEPIRRRETASFGCSVETVYYRLPRSL